MGSVRWPPKTRLTQLYRLQARRGTLSPDLSCPNTLSPLIPKSVDELVSVDVPTLTMSCKNQQEPRRGGRSEHGGEGKVRTSLNDFGRSRLSLFLSS
jgi:hypothetical protein